MGEPLLEVFFENELDVVSGVVEDAVAKEQQSQRAVFYGTEVGEMKASSEEISDGTSLFGIDVGSRDHTCFEEFGKSQGISGVSFYLSTGDHVETESVGERNLESCFLKTVDEPVPVESTLHHDLDGVLERLDAIDDLREFIMNLFLDMDREILIDYTDLAIPCAQVHSTVEFHWWPPSSERVVGSH